MPGSPPPAQDARQGTPGRGRPVSRTRPGPASATGPRSYWRRRRTCPLRGDGSGRRPERGRRAGAGTGETVRPFEQDLAAISMSIGRSSPVTAPASGSAHQQSRSARAHPGQTVASSSGNATTSPCAARRVLLRARSNPASGSRTYRPPGRAATVSTVRRPRACSNASRTSRSDGRSSARVASSRINGSASPNRARARAIRCRCLPAKRPPRPHAGAVAVRRGRRRTPRHGRSNCASTHRQSAGTAVAQAGRDGMGARQRSRQHIADHRSPPDSSAPVV